MFGFFNRKMIVHQISCVEKPQQKSVVECKHQHILNVTCALISSANYLFVFGHMLSSISFI